jgi:hypothetical protein
LAGFSRVRPADNSYGAGYPGVVVGRKLSQWRNLEIAIQRSNKI